MPEHASTAAQDYLKGIYLLAEGGPSEPVSTTAIAHHMGVSPASATNMLKRLQGHGLVDYQPYRGARLSIRGRAVALEMVRHHRLLETYLAEALGLSWDEVHEEAEILEHVISERLEDRMAALLGEPTADPHGHPIPGKDGTLPASSTRRLWDVHNGQRARVERVSDNDSEALRYLAEMGVRPGTQIEVVRRGPVEGPLFVRVPSDGDDEGPVEAISRELAEAVWVS